jgi:cell division protein FtsB
MRFAIGLVLYRELLYRFHHVTKKDEPRPAPKRRASEPSPKRPTRNRRIVHLLLLFVASVIVVDGLVGERGLLAMLRARHDYDELSATIARQRAENARLRDHARRLREDPSAIEEIARRELGLIKPGERVFIIKDVPPTKP